MYTILPFCAAVCGFDGPHPAAAIAMSIATVAIAKFPARTTAVFFDREPGRRPKVLYTG
jgi:hypothetical protein